MYNLQKICWLFLSVFVVSCAPLYVPNVVNSPMLSEKGEVNASIHAGTSGFDVQTAYAMTDHIGIMINGSFASKDSSTDTDYHEHKFGEFGCGYFTSIDNVFRFSTFAGLGMGKANASDTYEFFGDHELTAWGYYNRFFAQTSIGAATDFFDAGLCLRGSYVNFYRFEYGSLEHNKNKDNFFLEPVLFARVGWKMIKVQSQIGFSYSVTKNWDLDYQPIIFSFGLCFRLNKSDL
jgi:hypothetical protein